MKIEKLTAKNLQEFRSIRLEALRLEPQAFGDTYEVLDKKNDNFWIKQLSSKSQVWYGAYAGDSIVGIGSIKYAKALKFNHIAHLSGIYVKKEYRGQGIGKLLFKTRIDEAFNNEKIKKLKLIVNISQTNAIGLYESYGFKKVGDLEAEFKIGNIFYDAYLMELFKK
ncbi:MAG: GNAT family N-acetyltransferase [Microgenomates group bacterium]